VRAGADGERVGSISSPATRASCPLASHASTVNLGALAIPAIIAIGVLFQVLRVLVKPISNLTDTGPRWCLPPDLSDSCGAGPATRWGLIEAFMRLLGEIETREEQAWRHRIHLEEVVSERPRSCKRRRKKPRRRRGSKVNSCQHES